MFKVLQKKRCALVAAIPFLIISKLLVANEINGHSCEQNMECSWAKSDIAHSAHVTASSTLQNNARYHPGNVLDADPESLDSDEYWGNSETAWCEGVDGAGTGEWLRIEFNHLQQIAALLISAGYEKSRELFAANNRLKQATLKLSDGSLYTLKFGFHFYDLSSEAQTSYLPLKSKYQDINSPQMFILTAENALPKDVRWMELKIDEVVKGSKYDDTCISRIEIMSTWQKDF